MSNPQKTATLPAGILNPPPNNNQKRKLNDHEDNPLALIASNTYTSLFSANDEKKNIWKAVILRVDQFEDGVAIVKARIPEKDSTIPEPVEWVPPKVESCSHFLIDMHRAYIGKTGTEPIIGQIIDVAIPPDNSLQLGQILKVHNQYIVHGIKSTKIESGAKTASDAPQADVTIPPTSGDGIGSGQMNPASQVASETPESGHVSMGAAPLSEEDEARLQRAIAAQAQANTRNPAEAQRDAYAACGGNLECSTQVANQYSTAGGS